MPEKQHPLTIVITGGSLPTSFRIASRTPAFPQHLRDRFAGAIHFISMVKERRLVGDTLERADRIVELDPDAVIIWHGAGEAQFAPSLLMKLLQTDLTKDHPRNLGGILRTLKQHLFAVFQSVMRWPPRDLTPRLMGMKTFLSVKEFTITLESLVATVMHKTHAKIFLVVTYLPERGEWHFSRKTFEANMASIRRLDDGGRRLIIVDGGSELRSHPDNFAKDKYHLSAKGHVMMAALLEEQIRTHTR